MFLSKHLFRGIFLFCALFLSATYPFVCAFILCFTLLLFTEATQRHEANDDQWWWKTMRSWLLHSCRPNIIIRNCIVPSIAGAQKRRKEQAESLRPGQQHFWISWEPIPAWAQFTTYCFKYNLCFCCFRVVLQFFSNDCLFCFVFYLCVPLIGEHVMKTCIMHLSKDD